MRVMGCIHKNYIFYRRGRIDPPSSRLFFIVTQDGHPRPHEFIPGEYPLEIEHQTVEKHPIACLFLKYDGKNKEIIDTITIHQQKVQKVQGYSDATLRKLGYRSISSCSQTVRRNQNDKKSFGRPPASFKTTQNLPADGLPPPKQPKIYRQTVRRPQNDPEFSGRPPASSQATKNPPSGGLPKLTSSGFSLIYLKV